MMLQIFSQEMCFSCNVKGKSIVLWSLPEPSVQEKLSLINVIHWGVDKTGRSSKDENGRILEEHED